MRIQAPQALALAVTLTLIVDDSSTTGAGRQGVDQGVRLNVVADFGGGVEIGLQRVAIGITQRKVMLGLQPVAIGMAQRKVMLGLQRVAIGMTQRKVEIGLQSVAIGIRKRRDPHFWNLKLRRGAPISVMIRVRARLVPCCQS